MLVRPLPHIPQKPRHLWPLPELRHIHHEEPGIPRIEETAIAARRFPDILHLKQGPGLLDQIIAGPVHLVVRDVEAPHHHARLARPVLDILERVRVRQPAIERVRDGLLPYPRRLPPVAGFNLGSGILEVSVS